MIVPSWRGGAGLRGSPNIFFVFVGVVVHGNIYLLEAVSLGDKPTETKSFYFNLFYKYKYKPPFFLAESRTSGGTYGDIAISPSDQAIPRQTSPLDRIDKSVDEIEKSAFQGCAQLVYVDTHDGIRRVGKCAFYKCKSLRGLDLKSAVEIGRAAFNQCQNLESIEFGDKLETVGQSAFHGYSSLEHLKLTSIVTIEAAAFAECTRLTDVAFSERLGIVCLYRRRYIVVGDLMRPI
eukprot:scaffold808_cov129-Skeletonema_dohrnii-CCMP3373.AAC.1